MHLAIPATVAPDMLNLDICCTATQIYTRQLSPAPESSGLFPFESVTWYVHHCLRVKFCNCKLAYNIQKEKAYKKAYIKENMRFQAKQLNTTRFAGAHDRGCRFATANLHTRNDKKEKRFQAKQLNMTLFAGTHDRGCWPVGHEWPARWSHQQQRGQQKGRGGVRFHLLSRRH